VQYMWCCVYEVVNGHASIFAELLQSYAELFYVVYCETYYLVIDNKVTFFVSYRLTPVFICISLSHYFITEVCPTLLDLSETWRDEVLTTSVKQFHDAKVGPMAPAH